jgi:hypothetical protein
MNVRRSKLILQSAHERDQDPYILFTPVSSFQVRVSRVEEGSELSRVQTATIPTIQRLKKASSRCILLYVHGHGSDDGSSTLLNFCLAKPFMRVLYARAIMCPHRPIGFPSQAAT